MGQRPAFPHLMAGFLHCCSAAACASDACATAACPTALATDRNQPTVYTNSHWHSGSLRDTRATHTLEREVIYEQKHQTNLVSKRSTGSGSRCSLKSLGKANIRLELVAQALDCAKLSLQAAASPMSCLLNYPSSQRPVFEVRRGNPSGMYLYIETVL